MKDEQACAKNQQGESPGPLHTEDSPQLSESMSIRKKATLVEGLWAPYPLVPGYCKWQPLNFRSLKLLERALNSLSEGEKQRLEGKVISVMI